MTRSHATAVFLALTLAFALVTTRLAELPTAHSERPSSETSREDRLGPTAAGSRFNKFEPQCDLPFEDIAEPHPIDDACDAEGNATTDKHRAFYRAKNDFCAGGSPARVTFHSFRRLQQIVEEKKIPFGSHHKVPEDRSVLKEIYKTTFGETIGEGSLVRLVAFIRHAKVSNVGSGEGVNCKRKKREDNDVHLSLLQDLNDDDCNGLTAEMSPHFRPLAWDETSSMNNLDHPVRLTGHLLFDASHKPCPVGSPDRMSVWEIHPIYEIDVCKKKSLSACKVNQDSLWVPFHLWPDGGHDEGP